MVCPTHCVATGEGKSSFAFAIGRVYGVLPSWISMLKVCLMRRYACPLSQNILPRASYLKKRATRYFFSCRCLFAPPKHLRGLCALASVPAEHGWQRPRRMFARLRIVVSVRRSSDSVLAIRSFCNPVEIRPSPHAAHLMWRKSCSNRA